MDKGNLNDAKVEEVVFIYLYIKNKDNYVYRCVHKSYKEAHEDGQNLVNTGVTDILQNEDRHVFYPPHKIDRYECFKAKKITKYIEKTDGIGIPKEIWHGHYEDMEGNIIDY